MSEKKQRIKAVKKKVSVPEKPICYTGINANKSGIHTDKQFKKIMEDSKLCRGNTNTCPTTVEDWIEWAGAKRESPKVCKAVVKNNKTIYKLDKSLQRHEDKLKSCIQDKCKHTIRSSPNVKVPVEAAAICATKRCSPESKNVHKTYVKLEKASQAATRLWNSK